MDQGSDEWKAVRCGLLTASEMKLVITPTLKIADNDKTKTHIWALLSQRITGHVPVSYISDAMLRGKEDEILARASYAEHYAPVLECGFITNNRFGFTIGFSPDGLVGDDGFIECKSRDQKYQVQTIAECVLDQTIPDEYMIQIQTGFLTSERKWCDFISRSGGLPQPTIRTYPDKTIMDAIEAGARAFEKKIEQKRADYDRALASGARLIPTERRAEMEIMI